MCLEGHHAWVVKTKLSHGTVPENTFTILLIKKGPSSSVFVVLFVVQDDELLELTFRVMANTLISSKLSVGSLCLLSLLRSE